MSDRTVDIIIAVHDVRRNIRRAVGSVLSDGDPSIRALVVCHNLPAAVVTAELADVIERSPGRVRFIQLDDGVPSPSGPFNLGLAVSDADYVGIMGSDDELDPGAVAQWRAVAERHRADAVIAKVVRGDRRAVVRSPAKRVWKTGVLDFAKDRLPYRSAPLGLMRRDAVERLRLRLMDGARSGGDLPFVTRLWALGRVVPAAGVAAYIEHADAPVRVTWDPKPVRQELSAIREVLGSAFVRSLAPGYRDALATKLLRRNLMDTVRIRDGGRGFTRDDVRAFREVVDMIESISPRSLGYIALIHRLTVDELRRGEPDLEVVHRLSEQMANPRHWAMVRPAKFTAFFHAQAQPRYVAASALIKVGASRFLPLARNTAVGVAGLVLATLVALLLRRR
ncbi:glycosyltransferase [Microbacterium sp. BDGP8]|uniref:glycosyltransferase family 2 protein n=1 Tax=unclassified Microbacterium TaxID=2609290 RepID=UPI00249DFBDD|nr:glycosyltransferase [Microbacterium sp. BDGP8]WHE35491.1 glycosyltransferase [Microbacterium sp. BDGP8]